MLASKGDTLAASTVWFHSNLAEISILTDAFCSFLIVLSRGIMVLHSAETARNRLKTLSPVFDVK
jgi:hypothetical protein